MGEGLRRIAAAPARDICEELAAGMLAALEHRPGVAMATGREGAGKSRLAARLAGAPSRRATVRLLSEHAAGRGDVPAWTCLVFGLEPFADIPAETRLAAHFCAERGMGRAPVLVIDDADRLNDAELAQVGRLVGAGLSLALIGGDALRATLLRDRHAKLRGLVAFETRLPAPAPRPVAAPTPAPAPRAGDRDAFAAIAAHAGGAGSAPIRAARGFRGFLGFGAGLAAGLAIGISAGMFWRFAPSTGVGDAAAQMRAAPSAKPAPEADFTPVVVETIAAPFVIDLPARGMAGAGRSGAWPSPPVFTATLVAPRLDRTPPAADASPVSPPWPRLSSGVFIPQARPASITPSANPGPVASPWVVVHYRAAAEGRAEALAEVLRLRGFGHVTLREVGFTISRTNIRYYFDADRPLAAALGRLVAEEEDLPAPLAPRDFSGYEPLPGRMTLEVWLSGAPPLSAS
ncbi:MAG: AAA family ATPase [Pikeienuella sp.]